LLSPLRCLAFLFANRRSASVLLTLRSTYSPPKLICPRGRETQRSSGDSQVRKKGSVGSPLVESLVSGLTPAAEERGCGACTLSSTPAEARLPTTRGRARRGCEKREGGESAGGREGWRGGAGEIGDVEDVGEVGERGEVVEAIELDRRGRVDLGRAWKIRRAESRVSKAA
jgi:hypothetical protein